MVRALVVLLVICCALGCTSKDRAGNGSETTNQIAGRLLMADGTPAVAAHVTLLSHHGVPDTVATVQETQTQADGSFAFLDLPQGGYSLRAFHAASGTEWLQESVLAQPADEGDSLQGVLQQPAVLHLAPGTFPANLGGVWVLRAGGGAAVEVRNDVDSYLTVAAGLQVVELRIVNAAQGVERIWAMDSLDVMAGDTLLLNELKPWTAERLAEGMGVLPVGDFESGDLWNGMGAIWWVFDDAAVGGTSQIAFADPDSNGVDSNALHFSYQFGAQAPTFVGSGFAPLTALPGYVVNLAGIDSVRFRIRGTGVARLQVCVRSDLRVAATPSCLPVLDTMPTEWTSIELDWEFGTDSLAMMDVRLAQDFTFMITTVPEGTDQGELWLDDVQWVIGQ